MLLERLRLTEIQVSELGDDRKVLELTDRAMDGDYRGIEAARVAYQRPPRIEPRERGQNGAH